MTRRIALQFASIVVFLAVWQCAVSLSIVNKILLPEPLSVFNGAFQWLRTGEIWEHLNASLFRVGVGYAIGVTLGIFVGMFLGWSRQTHGALTPLLEMLRTVSPISWIPLSIVWFGIGDRPAIFIIAIASFFPVYLATLAAYREIQPILMKVSLNYGARGFFLLNRVLIPACLPRIFTGLKISLGVAWMVIVAAEMVGMRSGLGYLVLDSRNGLRTDLVLSAMLVIGIVGLVLDYGMNVIESYVVKGRSR